jgi:hypothetical protein
MLYGWCVNSADVLLGMMVSKYRRGSETKLKLNPHVIAISCFIAESINEMILVMSLARC